MDTVIYSATPLLAFSGGVAVIGFMLVLGIVGAFLAVFRKKQKMYSRIVTGGASTVLLLAAVGVGFNLYHTVVSGDRTVSVHVNDKKAVESNCGNGDSICTSYLLETQTGTKSYDFTVAKSAYEKAEVGVCYQVTYYPAQSLFGKYLQEQDYSATSEAASTITRIEKTNCP